MQVFVKSCLRGEFVLRPGHTTARFQEGNLTASLCYLSQWWRQTSPIYFTCSMVFYRKSKWMDSRGSTVCCK